MQKKINLDDTIVAISTPVGEGGIGIVRLTGKDSLPIADKIFKSKDNKLPSEFESYTTHYGHIVCRSDAQCEVIDEVILTVMRAPKSYTKEDIIEINCHGGITPLRRVLELVLSLEARLAQPGEFTKRAFLNGRIDLTQAESVLDIIRSKTDTSLRTAMSQLEGDFSKKVKDLRLRLIDLHGHVEASIDFPEEDIDILSNCGIEQETGKIIKELKALVDSADRGRILMEGVSTVICGKPNVGKSSLMNSLMRQRRVIVSHIPGTTRDAIEEIININGIPLRIIDTAGITETDDFLTKEGVERSRHHMESADLVLFLLDGSQQLCKNDKAIMNEIKDKKVIVVVNKTDLPKRLKIDKIKKVLHDKKIIEISVAKKKNLKRLEDIISEMVWGGQVSADHTSLVTNARHKALLIQSKNTLERLLRNLRKRISSEFIALDTKEAIESLSEITGETVDIDILDKIFSKFCIGK